MQTKLVGAFVTGLAIFLFSAGAIAQPKPGAGAAAKSAQTRMRVGGCPPGWTAGPGSTSINFTCTPPLPPAGFTCPEGSDFRVEGCSIRCIRHIK